MTQPVVQDRKQLRSEELPEFSMVGPFGGIQSELPQDLIENYGFLDLVNIILKTGAASVRPGWTALSALPAPSDESINGIADFFTENTDRIQVAFTKTKLCQFFNNAWNQIPGGPAFTGGNTDFFNSTVVNNKLCFSQGVDPVMLWDGVTPAYSLASPDALASKYLMELNTHLVVANTIRVGSLHSQNVAWTVAGDPTDWTSFGSGSVELLNNLGPIRGLCKLFQTGYALHQLGITQIIPTGIGTAPFQFVPLTSRARGNICPQSLATNGNELACYVGKDNVYAFNGSASEPIGDMPIDGRKRLGARTRIFLDLQGVDPLLVLGYVSQNVNGRNFNAYWLVIPGVSIWVYNFDEQNWTRFTYDKVWTAIGTFFAADVIRIMDLIGAIQDQQWTPDSLLDSNPFDAMLLGGNDGVPAFVDFTNFSEKAWSISGVNVFSDPRHRKTIVKFRLCVNDIGPATYTVTVRNQYGLSQTVAVTLGTGSGLVLGTILPFKVNGIRLYWTVQGAAGQPASFIEFSPVYDIGGEERGRHA